MSGIINGLYVRNDNRSKELDDRLYKRNITSAPIKMGYSIRSVPTKYVHMPILDCHLPPKEHCGNTQTYNTSTMFTPASSLPFEGYQSNIDVETRLRGTVFPMQSCPQAKYIPSSSSDLYDNSYLTKNNNNIKMTNSLLFKNEQFYPFNPNSLNIGTDTFNNNTRVQVKNL